MYEGAENALSKVPEVTLGFWIIKILATMYAASGYELLKSLKASGGGEDWGALAVAFLVSTITAFVAVKWLLGYIQTHRFTGFAIYRIILGIPSCDRPVAALVEALEKAGPKMGLNRQLSALLVLKWLSARSERRGLFVRIVFLTSLADTSFMYRV